jgi:hypothetical protein
MIVPPKLITITRDKITKMGNVKYIFVDEKKALVYLFLC